MSQVGHESGGLQFMEEIASGQQYEGRVDLGNTQPGDGRRFKGRGPIQVTGRNNYSTLSKWAFERNLVPSATFFVDQPEQLGSDQYGFIGVVWYWTSARDMNKFADAGDIEGGSVAVNGRNRQTGGPGLLLGGSPGVPPARVTVLGGGVVGTQAALLAVGMRADVTILDTSPHRVRELEEQFGRQLQVLHSQGGPAISAVRESDVVIGAVLVPGAAAPRLLTRDDLRLLRPGALLIDVAIDQGGCFETSRPTTYEAPTYQVDGITHYCVANMPGGVPRTSTRALTNATLPYVRHLAGLGVDAAFDRDPGLRRGLNTRAGAITHQAVAAAFG